MTDDKLESLASLQRRLALGIALLTGFLIFAIVPLVLTLLELERAVETSKQELRTQTGLNRIVLASRLNMVEALDSNSLQSDIPLVGEEVVADARKHLTNCEIDKVRGLLIEVVGRDVISNDPEVFHQLAILALRCDLPELALHLVFAAPLYRTEGASSLADLVLFLHYDYGSGVGQETALSRQLIQLFRDVYPDDDYLVLAEIVTEAFHGNEAAAEKRLAELIEYPRGRGDYSKFLSRAHFQMAFIKYFQNSESTESEIVRYKTVLEHCAQSLLLVPDDYDSLWLQAQAYFGIALNRCYLESKPLTKISTFDEFRNAMASVDLALELSESNPIIDPTDALRLKAELLETYPDEEFEDKSEIVLGIYGKALALNMISPVETRNEFQKRLANVYRRLGRTGSYNAIRSGAFEVDGCHVDPGTT